MSAPLVLQQYWQLIRTLMFPLRATRWMTVGFMGLLALGGLLLWWFDQPIVLMIGSGALVVISILIGVMVPPQMLSLVSSKQLSWIPGLRSKTFFILLSLYSLIALTSALLFSFKPNGYPFLTSMATAITLVAVIAAAMLITSVYFQGFQPFIFASIWLLYFAVEQLVQINALVCIAVGLLVWGALYWWWCRWIPEKYLVNYMTLSPAKMREMQEQKVGVVQAFNYWVSSTPKSLCGTLLLGTSDGLKAQLKYELGQVIALLLMVLLCSFLLRGMTEAFFLKMAPVIIFTFMSMRNVQFQVLIYRNLNRAWIYFDGSRTRFFNYVERQYFQHVGIAYGTMLCIIVGINFVFGNTLSLYFLATIVVISGLFAAPLFYLGWIIYHKTTASLGWLGWLSGIMVILFILLLTSLSLFWQPAAGLELQNNWWLILGMLVVLVCMRYWAIRVWSRMSFYRVKN